MNQGSLEMFLKPYFKLIPLNSSSLLLLCFNGSFFMFCFLFSFLFWRIKCTLAGQRCFNIYFEYFTKDSRLHLQNKTWVVIKLICVISLWRHFVKLFSNSDKEFHYTTVSECGLPGLWSSLKPVTRHFTRTWASDFKRLYASPPTLKSLLLNEYTFKSRSSLTQP